MNKQKLQSGFAHLAVIIIIVALIVTLGFLYWQNFMQSKSSDVKKDDNSVITPVTKTPVVADPMADWKAYTSAQYGYSFKYPTDWTITEDTSDKAGGPSNPNIIITSPSGYDLNIYIFPVGSGGWGVEGRYASINYSAKLVDGKIVLSDRNYNDGSAVNEAFPNQEIQGYVISFSFDYKGDTYIFFSKDQDATKMDTADEGITSIVSTWRFN